MLLDSLLDNGHDLEEVKQEIVLIWDASIRFEENQASNGQNTKRQKLS